MKPILCVGAASWDVVLGVDAFPAHPTKVLARRCVETAAGMASAAAMTISSLGGRAGVLARVGDDEHGARWLEGMRKAGVDTHLVEQLPGARTALSAIIVDAGGDRLIVPHYDSALWATAPECGAEDVKNFSACLVDTRWPAASAQVLRHARDAGIPTLLDADIAPVKILRDLVPLADHVIFSNEALAALSTTDTVVEQLEEVRRSTSAHLGVTRGELGATLVVDGKCVDIPAPQVTAVDTLSAGDVFHGAYLLALMEGKGPVEAARFANVAAALKCERFGGIAGRPARAEVDACLRSQGGVC